MLLDFNSVNEQSLQALIDDKILENSELEYKQFAPKDKSKDDNQKDKLIEEITSFANANGGILVLGMNEENGVPTELAGIDLPVDQFDQWQQTMVNQMQSKVHPHLYGVACKRVPLADEKAVIVIFIPKSYSKPHAIEKNKRYDFRIRYSNCMMPMDLEDIRKQFLFTASFRNEIKYFRKERISMILANEMIGDFGTGIKVVFHTIPEWSFDLGNSVDVEQIYKNKTLSPFRELGTLHYNVDGLCISLYSSSHQVEDYTQLFRNGIVETAVVFSIAEYGEEKLLNWEQLQKSIILAAQNHQTVLEQLNVPKPWYLSISLLNAQGYRDSASSIFSKKIDRDIIHSTDGVWREDNAIDDALKPVLDSLSNAFGHAHSELFDSEGKIITIDQ